MSRLLLHRGPDDHGQVALGEVGLAARRLSIIDLDRGHQPIGNEEGTSWVVLNGEIYNYQELRQDLLGRGHVFKTATDTEVIVHLYEELQERLVDRLRGMFALAVWDAKRRRLLLARDRFGQKPLFYHHDGNRLLFASEIKSILAGLGSVPPLDLEALDDYLSLRFIPAPATMFQGIRKLPPGHLLVLEVAAGEGLAPAAQPRLEVRPYWSLAFLPKQSISEEDAVAEVRERVREAVESHLVSDVRVGAFLSGGMDSSLVVAMMAQALAAPVPTFSIGVQEADFNELPFAALVARRYGTDHHEEIVRPDIVELLPRMIHHLDEPSDPIAACIFHAALLASRHVKVVLTGDGGDEMFAGFDRYIGYRGVGRYAALPAPVRRYLLGPLISRLPESAGYKTFSQKVRWLHDLAWHQGGRRYAEATVFFRFGGAGKEGLYTETVNRHLAGRDATQCIVDAFQAAVADDDLDRMLYADVETRLPEHSLVLTDRMTMANSLEGRSPFLDHRLAEFVATLPCRLKVKGRQPKYLMRRVAEAYLPPEILRRPKQGFMFPFGYWMKGPLVPLLRALSERSAVVEAGLFRPTFLSTLIDEHLAGSADHHVRLWMLLNVEIWFRMYFQAASLADLQGELAQQVASASR